jgi:hypothetical protein
MIDIYHAGLDTDSNKRPKNDEQKEQLFHNTSRGEGPVLKSSDVRQPTCPEPVLPSASYQDPRRSADCHETGRDEHQTNPGKALTTGARSSTTDTT